MPNPESSAGPPERARVSLRDAARVETLAVFEQVAGDVRIKQ